MKNKVISLLLVTAMISIAGCGSKESTVEPTEVVIETETEEPTEEEEIIETETEEPSPFSNIKDENGEYTEELIGTLAMYPFFEGKTESEIREYLASDDDLQCYLRDGKVADIEFYLESLYDFYGNDKSGSTNASSSDTNNSSTSNKGNSSSSKSESTVASAESTQSTSSSSSSNSDLAPGETYVDGVKGMYINGEFIPSFMYETGEPQGEQVYDNVYSEVSPDAPTRIYAQAGETPLSEQAGYSVGDTWNYQSLDGAQARTYIGNDLWTEPDEGQTIISRAFKYSNSDKLEWEIVEIR